MNITAALYAMVATVVRRLPRNVSLTSASTLSTLERQGPRRITDLAVIEGVAQPSMTVLVRALERSGLVERRGDPTDKRVTLVALTRAGAAFVRARRQATIESLEQLIDELDPGERAALAAAIPALEHLRELDQRERNDATRLSDTPARGSAR